MPSELKTIEVRESGNIEFHRFLGDLKTGDITEVEITTVGNPEKRLIPWDDYVNTANHILRWLFRKLI